MSPVTNNEADRWYKVGQRLEEAREEVGISKRAAAKAAGFSETLWRQLESGERTLAKDLKVPPAPSNKNLEAAAVAVGIDPAELFALADRQYSGRVKPDENQGKDLNQRVQTLEDAIRDLRELLEQSGIVPDDEKLN